MLPLPSALPAERNGAAIKSFAVILHVTETVRQTQQDYTSRELSTASWCFNTNTQGTKKKKLSGILR